MVGIFCVRLRNMHRLLKYPRVEDPLLGVSRHDFLSSHLKTQLSSHRGNMFYEQEFPWLPFLNPVPYLGWLNPNLLLGKLMRKP